ncbi:Glycerol kinase [Apophysomyces ossiformis]|uniref:glycerol kinase n=1 Tax=Apophysomyces ossiformis TaxID=679940 RepID=A0A8H7BPG8_9FUNG|nr:Glycerol kinase [Apophysomyces ossiformis]
MPKFVGAIDQGTTSTRFVIFDERGSLVTYHQIEFEQHYPQPGWVEHDPYELLDSAKTCIEHAVSKLEIMGHDASDIQAIGITNQRETTIVWDSETGQPLYPAIVWSDARTVDTVHALAKKSDKGVNALQHLCGLPLTTYFSAVKLRWLLDNVPAVAEAQQQGRLQFGTVDTWLIYNLTGGLDKGVVVTDVTNASRTMLMDIHTLSWSDEAKRFFDFDHVQFPKIVSSSQVYGNMSDGSLEGIPIAGCLGDQQAALVGQKCFNVGDAKNTYGTGCFMLFNTGDAPVISKNGLLSTVAYQLGTDAAPAYALEGSVAVAGSSINWLRDNLGLIQDAAHLNELAQKVNDTAGVYFVTAFAGLFAPYWRSDARGTICGMTQYTTLEHICRATLEAVCYQSRAILDAMNKESQKPLRSLKVDGGMSNSDLCMQIQADILGIGVQRPQMRETTALGSAIAAGFATGIWKTFEDLDGINAENHTIFEGQITEEKRRRMYNGWNEAVKRSYGWASDATTAPQTEVY